MYFNLLVLRNIKEHDERISEAESSIMLLKSMGASSNGADGGSGFISALEGLIDKLRKEIHSKFAEKDDLNSIKKRLSDVESGFKDLEDDCKNLNTSMSQCRDLTD